MDLSWNRNKKISLLDETGQSSVEYILLFGIVVILSITLFKSEAFNKLFGNDGVFAKTYREEVEFSYRHAVGGRKAFTTPNYSSPNHMSYKGNGSETRFFGARDKYPAN